MWGAVLPGVTPSVPPRAGLPAACSPRGPRWLGPLDPFCHLLLVPMEIVGLLAVRAGREGIAFTGTFVTIALAVWALFAALFPDVMPSSIDPAYNLTAANAASSTLTLQIMTAAALLFTGLGGAGFSIMQATLVYLAAPPEMRSRGRSGA